MEEKIYKDVDVFPRGKHSGVIPGGCRLNGDWDEKFEEELGERIEQKCYVLVPELGKREDLGVIKEGLGFRR